MLQIGTGKLQVQFSLMGIRNMTGLLAHDDGNGISSLGNTLCRTVTQSQIAGNVGVVGHRQDTASAHDLAAGNDEGAIVQRTVFKENILNQARIDVGLDHIARALIVSQRYRLLDDDEGASLGLGHVHAGINHRQNPLFLILDFRLALEQFFKDFEAPAGTQLGQEPLDLVLEQDNKDKQTDVNEFVHECAYQAHVQNLVHHHPGNDKGEHADKDVERTRIFHRAVQVVEQGRHQQDVDQGRPV